MPDARGHQGRPRAADPSRSSDAGAQPWRCRRRARCPRGTWPRSPALKKRQRLRQDARLLILATGLRTAGPTGARCLSIVAHAGCSMFSVTELPTTHHSVQPPMRHRVCELLSSSPHTRCADGLIRGLTIRIEQRTESCPTRPTRGFRPNRSSASRSRETSCHAALPRSRCPGSCTSARRRTHPHPPHSRSWASS